MTENTEAIDLKERLKLIEAMIAEGRRTTESWGWVFVLWGVAYYAAILWTALAHWPWAWPVTMVGASMLTWVIAAGKDGSNPNTTMGRSIASIWIAMGITMLLLFPALGLSGRIDVHILTAVASGILGMTNAASSMILKWRMQFACAVVWWVTAVLGCFGNGKQTEYAFLAAIFFCQIVFGVYGMIRETAERKQEGRHA